MALTELLQDLISPALYERIDTALPEFRFKKHGPNGSQGYISTNGLKIDGTNGDAVGRVRIYPNNIWHLIDHRGGFVSMWDYIQQRDGLSQKDTLLRLAELAEVKLPERQLTDEELQRAESYRRRAKIWEELNNFLIDCLSNKDNPIAHSAEAKAVRDYLTTPRSEGGRGYDYRTDIRLPGTALSEEVSFVEAGFLPDPAQAYKHLLSLGYDEREVRSTLRLTEQSQLGKDGYFLTLPYRDNAGAIRGLIIRNIRYNPANRKAPKYLFTKSLEETKGKLLYNLKPLTGSRDLIIVESQFDAQLATVRGLENVVAIGGKNLTPDQAKQILRQRTKPKSITLLLDNEAETVPQIKAAIDTLLNQDSALSVYVASIPHPHIKDLEEYLLAYSVEQFREEVLGSKHNKVIYWKYFVNSVYQEYETKQGEDGFTDEQTEDFLKDLVKHGNRISLPAHRQQYINDFTALLNQQGWNITEETLAATADLIKYSEDRAEQEREFKRLLATAKDLQEKGETAKALQLLTERTKEIKQKDRATEFNGLLVPVDESQVKERLQSKPDKLRSGITIQGDELLIPTGAVSIIAAPTSHGKTTFLLNLGLNLTQNYPNKKIHTFSYEEDADSVLISALNAYIGEELNDSKRRDSNRDLIRSFLKDGSTQYVKGSKEGLLKEKKDRFFKEMVSTQRFNVHYVDYSADTLIDAIYYLHKQGDVGAILIDYIQLLHKGERGNNKYGNRQEELKQICLDLKDVSVETGLPIILGAQFNREVTNHLLLHATKISEAGDIERVANLILGFWNNDFEPLNPSTAEQKMIEGRGMNTPNTLYTKILKYRGGRPGLSDNLQYNGNAGKIGSPVSGSIQPF